MRSRVHLIARRCTEVSSLGTLYIRILVRVPRKIPCASTRGEVPKIMVLCTVVLLCLSSVERVLYMYLDTCTPKRKILSDCKIGCDEGKILSNCKIGCGGGKILSEKYDLLEGTERLLYFGARRSRRLYLNRRLQERPDDTTKLIQLGMRRYRRVVYRSTYKTQGSMQKIAWKEKAEYS